MLLIDWLYPLRRLRRQKRTIRNRRWFDRRAPWSVESLEDRTLLSAPTAVDDYYFVRQDVTLNVAAPGVLGNDTDPENDPLTAQTDVGPTSGTLTLNANGSFDYTPNLGFSGIDSFTYKASDGALLSAAATVTIDAGDAAGDDLAAARATSLTTGVKSEYGGYIGDGDWGDQDVDLFRVDLSAGERLLADIDADELDDGTQLSTLDSILRIFDEFGTELAYNDDANDPDTGIHHLDAAVSYTASVTGTYYVGVSGSPNDWYDPTMAGSGDFGSMGEFRLQLTIFPNSPPTAADDQADVEVDSGQMAINVLRNDSDPDGNSLTVSSVTQPTSGTAAANGSDVLYQPNAAFTGTDTFSYTADDGYGGTDTATVTVNVHAADDTLATARAVSLTLDVESEVGGIIGDGVHGSLDVDLFRVDLSAGERLTADIDAARLDDGTSLSGLNSHLRIFDAAGTELASNGDANDPDTGTFGSDSVVQFTAGTTGSYYVGVSGYFNELYDPNTAGSGSAGSTGAYWLQLLRDVNSPPVATDDSLAVEQDSFDASLNVLANDSDPDGGTLTITSATTPTSGSNWTDGSTVFYTPNAGYTGSDSFSYTIQEPDGLTASATVTLDVHQGDDTIATARAVTITLGTKLEQGGIIGDGANSMTEVDLFAVSLSADQLLTIDIDARRLDNGTAFSNLDSYIRVFDSAGTQLASNNDGTDPDTGSFLLDSALVFTATATATYYIGVSDSANSSYDPNMAGSGMGNSTTGAYRLQLTVEQNNPPSAVDDPAETIKDTAVSIAVLANDSDPDGDAISFVSLTQPTSGSASWSAETSTVQYTPNAGFVGTDTFTYTIQDEHGAQATATVTVQVGNNAPVANGDAYEAVTGQQLSISAANGVLANDTDANGDPLTAELVTTAQFGTLNLLSDGSFTYTSNAGFTGTDSFTYKAFDGTDYSNVATVEITVYGGPVWAEDDIFSGAHDRLLTVAAPGLLANDWDFEDDPLTVAAVPTGPTSGLLTWNADGSFTYTPSAGFVGTDSFTYQATDGINTSNTATVTINVINKAPRSTNDFYRTDHDTALTVAAPGVLANDADWEQDTLSAVRVGSPTSGTLTLNADGSFTYTPGAGFVGTDTFTYRPDDGITEGNLATVTIDVVNTAAQAFGESYQTTTNQALSVAAPGILENDWDKERDSLTITVDTGPTSGTFSFLQDGSFTYTPNLNFIGTDSFTYHVNDGFLNSASATVTIDVLNQRPTAIADYHSVAHDTTLSVAAAGVLANDEDREGDALTAVLVTAPLQGTLTLAGDGSFTYVPAAGYTGTVTFTYRADDPFGQSDPATVMIDVTNAAPAARPESYRVLHGSALSVLPADGVLANDADPDGDSLEAVLVTTATNGTLALNADGSFTYTPNAGFVGTDSFTYKARDGLLAESAVVEVTLDVYNTAPVAVGDSYSTVHDSSLSVLAPGLLANDYDADGDALSPALVTTVSNGTLTWGGGGSFTYAPTAGFVGTDSFTYKVGDGAAQTDPVTVTIEVTNSVPWANQRSYSVVHDRTLSVLAPGLLEFAGDADGDSLSVVIADPVDSGTFTLGSGGAFTYTPNAGFVGTDTFQFKVSDGIAQSDPVPVEITVTNAAPLAAADYYSVSHGRTLSVTAAGVLDNDSDPDSDLLTVSLVTGMGVSNGTLTLNSNGTFTYTPNAGYVGQDSFTYRASDGISTADATVTIDVVNSAPQPGHDVYGVFKDQTVTTTAATGVLANDVDADGDAMTVSLVDNVQHGTLTLNSDGSFAYTPPAGFLGEDSFTYQASDGRETGPVTRALLRVYDQALVAENDELTVSHDRTLSGDVLANDFNWNGVAVTAVLVAAPASGALTLNTDGTFTYAPAAASMGTVTFTYLLDTGTSQSNTAIVTINVVNEAPQTVNASYSTSHGRALSVLAADGLLSWATDADGDPLTASLVAAPASGTVTVNPDGSFTYTPTSSTFVGSDTFTYKVNDGLADSNTATVTIEITNAAPVGYADGYAVHAGQTLSVTVGGVLANDRDADGDALTASLVATTANGLLTLNGDGTFTYTPNAGFVGTDQFTYTAGDGIATSATTTVTVTVHNAAALVVADSYAVLHDRTLTISALEGVLANDLDWDGDPLTAILVTGVGYGPTSGTVSLAQNGSFTYTPNSGFVGSDTFTYKVNDGFIDSAEATVTIEVVNHVPVALGNTFQTGRNKPITFAVADLLANDSDADGDSLTFTRLTTVANGTLTENLDGTYTYTPNAGYVGGDSFTYKVGDGVAETAAVTVQIDVVNTPPTAAGDTFRVAHDRTLTAAAGELFRNDFDFDGDALTAELVTTVSHGTLMLGADGSFTYTPTAGYVGSDSFQYRVKDGIATSEPATVRIDVENSAPGARDDYHRIVHDTTLTVDAASGLLAISRDADEESLTATIISGVLHGTLTVNADGSYSYTPAARFVGTDSFTYQVSDGIDSSTTGTVTIEVTNTPPSAGVDLFTTPAGTMLTVNAPGVLANDGDFDQETLTASLVDGPAKGTLTFNANGSFSYTPNSGFVGTDSFTYKVSDGVAESYGTAFVEVLGTQNTTETAPRAGKDYYKVTHSTTLSVGPSRGVLSNDFDPNGDWLDAILVTGPTNGTLTLNADGSFDYVPNAGGAGVAPFTGTDSFTYKATDSTNESLAATATIEVTNDVSWARNTASRVHHTKSLSATETSLTSAAGDADGDSLTFALVTGPANGTLTLNSDGTFGYTPNAGFVGTDSFAFKVNDKVADSSTATVSIDVTNAVPTVLDLFYPVQHGEMLSVAAPGVLSVAVDSDGDSLTASLTAGPTNGTLSLLSDGSFTYTPNAGFAGTDTFTFVARDGAQSSQPATVTIDVSNTDPEAFDATYTVHQGTSRKVVPNAWDADGDSLVLELVGGPASGTLTYENQLTDGSTGPITFTGGITYTPNAGFVGSDTVTLKSGDGVTQSEPATITFNVTNIDPVATDARYSTLHEQTLVVSPPGLFLSAWDGDGDELEITVVTGPTSGTLSLHKAGAGGPSDPFTGGFTYTPGAGFAGTDTFTYKVSDGAAESQVATITIDVTNNEPVAVGRFIRFHHADATLDGLGNKEYRFSLAEFGGFDADDDPITFLKATDPTSGTVTVTTGGQVTYKPTSASFLGTDSFTFKVNDGYADSAAATVTISVTNTKSQALNDFFSIKHGTILTITPSQLLANDFDFDGEGIKLGTVGAPSAGTLTYDATADTYTYDPGTFVGTATFTYTIRDGIEESAEATVEIEVKNTAPWAIDRTFIIEDEGSVTFTLNGPNDYWDLDDDSVTVQVVTSVTGGTLTQNTDGSYTYTANPGTLTDSLTYKLSDGTADSDTFTVTFEVKQSLAFEVDDGQFGKFHFGDLELPPGWTGTSPGSFGYTAPTVPVTKSPPLAANDNLYHVVHGRTYDSAGANAPSVLANDFDVDGDTLTIVSVSGVTDSAGGAAGAITMDASGHFTWTAPHTPGDYSFTYAITDGDGDPVDATVTIRVTNEAPIADNDYRIMAPNSAGVEPKNTVFGYLGWDPDGDPITVTILTGPSSGSLATMPIEPSGQLYWEYTPSDDFEGTDSFTYQVTDNADPAASATGTVNIAVTNDPNFRWNVVEAEPDMNMWATGTITGNVLDNDDSKASSQPLTAALDVPVPGLMLNSDGSYTFTPPDPAQFVADGGVVANYTATDEFGNSASSTLKITPYVLRPGESVVGVTNGTRYDALGTYSDGLGSVIVWTAGGGTVNIMPHDGTVFKIDSADSVAWDGAVHILTIYVSPGGFSCSVGGQPCSDTVSLGGHINVDTMAGISDTTAGTIRATSDGAIGRMYAQGNIYWVSTETSIHSTHSDGNTYTVETVSGSIGTAGATPLGVKSLGKIGGVLAGMHILGPVSAGGHIGTVHAVQGSILDTVQAGGNIGFFRYPLGSFGSSFGNGEIGGVEAGQRIEKAVTASGGGIGYVHAGQDLLDNISASGLPNAGIYFVESDTASIHGDITALGGLGSIKALSGNILGNLSSQKSIGVVQSGYEILGNITASGNGTDPGHVGGVFAGTHLRGNVTAQDGSISIVHTAYADHGGIREGDIAGVTISATESIYRVRSAVQVLNELNQLVWAGGDILTGTIIKAVAGYIGDIRALDLIDATIRTGDALTTGRFIGSAEAALEIKGSIDAGTAIGTVLVPEGTLSAPLTAGTDIGKAYAQQTITGNINASGSITEVTALALAISGSVTAQDHIGEVTAGTDITQAVEATTGNIGSVVAGEAGTAQADISGNVTAGKSIAGIIAIVGDLEAYQQSVTTPTANDFYARLAAWYADPNADPTTAPRPPRAAPPPRVGSGNITSAITAGASIGLVAASGNFVGSAGATQRLSQIWALGNIDAALSSQFGSLAATAWGLFSGSIDAVGNITAGSYEDFSPTVASTSGSSRIATWGALNSASVMGPSGVRTFAYDSISTSTIQSQLGSVDVISYGNVQSHIDAAKTSSMGVLGAFQGEFLSQAGAIFGATLGKMQGSFDASSVAVLVALDKIKADIDADAAEITVTDTFDGSISTDKTTLLIVKGGVNAAGGETIQVASGDLYINAGTIGGTLVTDAGAIGLDVYGNLDGEVRGHEQVVAKVRGDVTKDILSTQGSVVVFADGPVSGDITANGANGGIGIHSWGAVSGDLTAENGPISAFARGDLTGAVAAGGVATITAWGDITKTVTAGKGAEVLARRDILQAVTAGESADVTAGGAISGEVKAGNGSAAGAFNATVVALGGITASVTAPQDAHVESFGSITGDVTAYTGNATVAALANYSGRVRAGQKAQVTAGGNVSSSDVKGFLLAQISAHGAVSTTQASSDRKVTVVADTNVTGVTITAGVATGGTATLGALQAISSTTLNAGGKVDVFAGTTADLTATTTDGDLDVTAVGDLQGTYTAGGNLYVTSFGAISSLTAASTNAKASVFASGNLAATKVSAETELFAFSLETITGEYVSDGTAGLYAGQDIDATATATLELNVTAGTTLAGTLKSLQHRVNAAATGATTPATTGGGGISATTTANLDANVTALVGSVTGAVTASYGNANVAAAGTITSSISAGADANVWATGAIGSGTVTASTISAGGHTTVVTFDELSAEVSTTGGHAIALAGTDVSGKVTAKLDALVAARTGQVTKDVTAQTGSATVVALGGISGNTSANLHAAAVTLGDITGTTTATAGHALAVAVTGQITAGVSAGLSAGAIAFGSISGALTGGTDAVALTLGSQLADVTAGRDAVVIAADMVSGFVKGDRDAVVWSYGLINGNVTATTRDAVVITWGSLTNSVTAGQDAVILALGGGANVIADAATDLFLFSMGQTTGTFTADRDALVWSDGMLSGSLTAGRDAAALSMESSSIDVTATSGDAFVFAFDKHQGIISAGQDAFLLSMGIVHSSVTATRDAGIYAVESIISSNVDGGRYAVLIGWDLAVPLVTVDGDQGAFVWTYGDFNGQVTSLNGPVVFTAYGNAWNMIVDAGTDAVVATVGDYWGRITAGGLVGVVTLGNFDAKVTAGADVILLGEGKIASAQTTAGKDVFIYAFGDVRGSFSADRDASAITYGNFDAGLSAGRDIGHDDIYLHDLPAVWARGSITGTLSAGRNIGYDLKHEDEHYVFIDDEIVGYDVFAYGTIDAALYAHNTAGSADGGHIGSVGAWGAIGGLMVAEEAIHFVRSGDDVTSTLIAPSIGSVIEFDATIQTDFPFPELPASIKQQVLDEAAAVYSQVLADRQALADQIAQFRADWAAARTRTAAEIASTRADVSADAAEARIAAQSSFEEDRNAARALMETHRRFAESELKDLQKAVERDKANLIGERDAVKGTRDAAYQDALDLRDEVFKQFEAADRTVAESAAAAAEQSRQEAEAMDALWREHRDEIVEAILMPFIQPPPAPPTPKGISGCTKDIHDCILPPVGGPDQLAAGNLGSAAFPKARQKDFLPVVLSLGHTAEIVLMVQPSPFIRGAGGVTTALRGSGAVDDGLRAATRAPRGARGPATAWQGFDEALAGGPIRDLTTKRIKITDRGIAVVERHLSRFDPDKANQIMIDRLRRIARGELKPTAQDFNFYAHELREYVRYRRLGWPKGVPANRDAATDLWRQTHSATLDDYGLPLRSENLLYHPDAFRFIGFTGG